MRKVVNSVMVLLHNLVQTFPIIEGFWVGSLWKSNLFVASA